MYMFKGDSQREHTRFLCEQSHPQPVVPFGIICMGGKKKVFCINYSPLPLSYFKIIGSYHPPHPLFIGGLLL
jgi:hypothetical protein